MARGQPFVIKEKFKREKQDMHELAQVNSSRAVCDGKKKRFFKFKMTSTKTKLKCFINKS